MTDSEHKDELRATRARLAKVIRRRAKVNALLAVLASLLFASVAAPLVTMDLLLASVNEPAFVPGEPAPMTVRVPHFSGFSDDRYEVSQGAVVVARGQMVDLETADLVQAVRAKMPAPGSALVGYFTILFTITLLYSIHLRGSHRGQLLRTQALTLLLLLGGAFAVKMALLFTSMSVFLVPLAAVALVGRIVVDRSVGLSTALLASVLFGMLVPFDLGVIAVLLLQGMAACLVAGDRRSKNPRLAGAGLVGGASAALCYIVLCYLTTGHSPMAELEDPLRSALAASVMGGLLGGVLAIPLKPLYQYMLGDITKSKLVELEDLSNPLLRQIAENSPGTWQHSLAMANMAEIAANAIGADGRLVRVGAYYHDLGKSLQPKYFIENLESGESSPHDRLPPEISCDAIFAHVTEGIRVARKHRLPERIIDFMYMHHGDGLLEYFWSKCREGGNPDGLIESDFRYPGVPPQSRETAILAICDAVEAASRTLKKPDERAVESLVQRIVYGKLHLGQLDQSGMSMADLRKISDSLRETIKHAHHGRIEYPWQREEKNAEAAAGALPANPAPASPAEAPAADPVRNRPGTTTQQIIREPRLDSLDTPRPYFWNDRARTTQRPALETAPTEPFASQESDSSPPAGGQATASHTTLPVEIEAVLAESVTPESAPTVPLLVSESQSVVAPPMTMIDADANESALIPEPELPDSPALPEAADSPEAPDGQAATARPASEPSGAYELASTRPISVAGDPARAMSPALAFGAAELADDSATLPPADENAIALGTPVPMGTAITGPPPATRTRPGIRTREKTSSGTRIGFPGAGQPAPELAPGHGSPNIGDAGPEGEPASAGADGSGVASADDAADQRAARRLLGRRP
jgi:putative nucleotidyltransferase with HDIG domain